MSCMTSAVSNSSQSSEIYQFMSDFKQLGKDLRSGDLAAAQQDFVTLSSDVPGTSSATTTPTDTTASSTSTSTDTTATTSTATTTTPDTTASATTATTGSSRLQAKEDAIAAKFQTLQQALQSGDISGAQDAYRQIKQSIGGGHHHYHGDHHGGDHDGASNVRQFLNTFLGGNSSTGSTSSSSATSATTSETSGTGDAAASSATTPTTTPTTSTTSSSGQSSTTSNAMASLGQLFETIGADLMSGDLAGVQQALTQFAQDLQSSQGSASVQGPNHHGHFSPSSAYVLMQGFIESQSLSAVSGSSSSSNNSSLDVTA